MHLGSPLPVLRPDHPYVVLLAGTLDEDPGSRPFRHVFLGQKAPWFEVRDDLTRYEGRPPPEERLPARPEKLSMTRGEGKC
ncbi:MAG: hypothetical protein ABFS46_14330 [Myxococcota bacterium]